MAERHFPGRCESAAAGQRRTPGETADHRLYPVSDGPGQPESRKTGGPRRLHAKRRLLARRQAGAALRQPGGLRRHRHERPQGPDAEHDRHPALSDGPRDAENPAADPRLRSLRIRFGLEPCGRTDLPDRREPRPDRPLPHRSAQWPHPPGRNARRPGQRLQPGLAGARHGLVRPGRLELRPRLPGGHPLGQIHAAGGPQR